MYKQVHSSAFDSFIFGQTRCLYKSNYQKFKVSIMSSGKGFQKKSQPNQPLLDTKPTNIRPVKRQKALSKQSRPHRLSAEKPHAEPAVIFVPITLPTQQSIKKLTREFIIRNSFFQKSDSKDLSKIKSLTLRDQDLHTFESTEEFKLHELATIQLLILSNNHLKTIQPLAELDTLISLNLTNNSIYDIAPLAELKCLKELYINSNQVKDVSPLSSLADLSLVSIYNNKIPYTEKNVAMRVFANLKQLDIDKNEVYRNQEKSQWLCALVKLKKFNTEPVSNNLRMSMTASQGFMSKTQPGGLKTGSGFFRPQTPLSSVSQNQERHAQIYRKIEAAEHNYLVLDNKYDDEIAKNAKLKSELYAKMQLKQNIDKDLEDNEEKRQKCEELRKTISSMKKELFEGKDPKIATALQELYKIMMQIERKKVEKKYPAAVESKVIQDENQPGTNSTSMMPHRLNEKPFDADEEIIIDSDEEEGHGKQQQMDSDEQINMLLSQNQLQLSQLKQELKDLA